MFALAALVIFAIAITPLLAVDSHHGAPAHRRHHEIAHRARGDISKRFSGARATYYAVGLGACGQYNKPSDFIVALNQAQFGSGYPGPHCFETITISYGGKTAQATIMDECPVCPYAGLDLSEGLFSYFADTGLGVLSIDWSFGASGGNPKPAPPAPKPPAPKPSTPPPPPPPRPTSTWHYEPPTSTSQYVPPPPMHTHVAPLIVHTTSKTTSTTHTTSHSTTPKPSTTSTSTTALPSATPAAIPVETTPDNLSALNLFVLNLGNLAALSIGA